MKKYLFQIQHVAEDEKVLFHIISDSEAKAIKIARMLNSSAELVLIMDVDVQPVTETESQGTSWNSPW